MTPKGVKRRVYLVEQTLCHCYTKYHVLKEMKLDINLNILYIFLKALNSKCARYLMTFSFHYTVSLQAGIMFMYVVLKCNGNGCINQTHEYGNVNSHTVN